MPLTKTVTAVLTSMTLAISPSGCRKTPGTGVGTEGICVIQEVRHPETLLPPGAEEPWIQASVRISCNPSPRDMRTLLTLERKQPGTGRWNGMQIGPPDTTTPGALGYTFTVIFGFCLEGSWRMTAKIKGTTPQGASFNVDAPTRTRQITC